MFKHAYVEIVMYRYFLYRKTALFLYCSLYVFLMFCSLALNWANIGLRVESICGQRFTSVQVQLK